MCLWTCRKLMALKNTINERLTFWRSRWKSCSQCCEKSTRWKKVCRDSAAKNKEFSLASHSTISYLFHCAMIMSVLYKLRQCYESGNVSIVSLVGPLITMGELWPNGCIGWDASWLWVDPGSVYFVSHVVIGPITVGGVQTIFSLCCSLQGWK